VKYFISTHNRFKHPTVNQQKSRSLKKEPSIYAKTLVQNQNPVVPKPVIPLEKKTLWNQ
jgi:hypothetical protein